MVWTCCATSTGGSRLSCGSGTRLTSQYLAPFAYYGVHDGLDLREIPWRRGSGYDITELTNVLTADHAWARRVIEQVRTKVTNPARMRALGFCVSVAACTLHGRGCSLKLVFLRWLSGEIARARSGSLPSAILRRARVQVVFTVDLFNEGVDVPTVDTLLLLRPTDSPTLFLQQLGHGRRRAHGKTLVHRPRLCRCCTARSFGSIDGSGHCSAEVAGMFSVKLSKGFRSSPAGCHLELDSVAQDVVLRSIRESIPTAWRDRCEELRGLGEVTFLQVPR